MRLRAAFDEAEVTYATTRRPKEVDVRGRRTFIVPDGNMSSKLRLSLSALQIASVILRVRPDVVISTGAGPGYIAIVFGKMLGARTIWIDSIANAEQLSLAGSKVRRWADHWLTQWPDLARAEGPAYMGSVL